MNLIESNIGQIRELCIKHKVEKLFAIGSVLTNRFQNDSDIDFVVDFKDVSLYDYADNYFDLKYSLENLLKREVDLLENKAINNPYFRKSIESSKKLVYG